MDKFSLYEFMTFFLPGILAVSIGFQILPSDLVLFTPISDLVNGLVYFIAALVAGLIIHRVTFSLYKYKWYKKLIMKSIDDIVKDANEGSFKTNIHNLKMLYKEENISLGDLFDKAYLYLEYQDKIAPAKMFQSMYFFLRNLLTLSFICIPVFIIVYWCKHDSSTVLVMLVIAVIFIIIVPPFAQFYRRIMVERIFNIFYITMTVKKEQ